MKISEDKNIMGAMNRRLDLLIELALEEDLDKNGDITSLAIFEDQNESYFLLSKDEGIFCGADVVKKVFSKVDPNILVDLFFSDGDYIKKGDIIATITGNVSNILQGERTAINFISFLSGIASATNEIVKSNKSKATILDTRKTLPGYRLLSKYAVLCGGAKNHRIGLYDMVMIKDNHIDAAGSISNAVKKVRDTWGNRYKIEVETRNIKEVELALDSNVDRIMLDNMDNQTMLQAISIIQGRCETEASGNMSIERLSSLSAIEIDYISFGSITHSVKAFDFSLRKENHL